MERLRVTLMLRLAAGVEEDVGREGREGRDGRDGRAGKAGRYPIQDEDEDEDEVEEVGKVVELGTLVAFILDAGAGVAVVVDELSDGGTASGADVDAGADVDGDVDGDVEGIGVALYAASVSKSTLSVVGAGVDVTERRCSAAVR